MEQKDNNNDIFELTRTELNSVLAYLGKRPAEEVFALVTTLINKQMVRAASTEQAVSPVLEVAQTETQAVAQ